MTTESGEVRFLRRAIELAVESAGGAGGPCGAVVVRDGLIVAEGTNLVTATNDPTAHAEVTAIRRACETLGTFDLSGCDLYSSCEPCPLCYAASLWARVGRLFHAATRDDAAAAGFDDAEFYTQLALPAPRRRVPVVHIRVEGAAAPFDTWTANPDRIPY